MSKKNTEEPKVTKQFLLDHLEEDVLDLSLYSLTKFPAKELALVPRATKLDFSQNRLTSLPGNLSDLKHIVELDLSQNLLSALPDAFGSLSNLQKLDLFKNKLTTLPLTFAQLKKLKWLDLKDNNLETGLQVAGGTCLDDSECRACATNAKAERANQKRLAEEREAQRKREEEEKMKKKEEQKLKAELRKRRQLEEEERKARQSEEQNKVQQEEIDQDSEEETEDTVGTSASRWKYCLSIGLVLVLIGVVLTLMFAYCDDLYNPSACHTVRQLALEKYQLLKQRLSLKS
ncbi:hypothetical protein EMCRGX_G033982 [Ephydatia muelleri]